MAFKKNLNKPFENNNMECLNLTHIVCGDYESCDGYHISNLYGKEQI